MNVHALSLPDVLVIEPDVHADDRGRFVELWQERRYRAAGIPDVFVQDNVSVSKHGVVRGLHAQCPEGQGKLVSVLIGVIHDVALDIRRGSPHFGRWVSVTLTAESGRQLWIPPGFAHGFAVTSTEAVVCYKCTAYWAPEAELTVRWDDPDLSVDWPVSTVHVSEKDGAAPLLREIDPERLPLYVAKDGA